MTPLLTRRALNRATLARQFLLERADLPVEDAVAPTARERRVTVAAGGWDAILALTPGR